MVVALVALLVLVAGQSVPPGTLKRLHFHDGSSRDFKQTDWVTQSPVRSMASSLVSDNDIRGLVADNTGQYLYWAHEATKSFRRLPYNADELGVGEEVILTDARIVQTPYVLALDESRRWLYWSDTGFRSIKRLALDDNLLTEPYSETVFSGEGYTAFAIDARRDPVPIYWADSETQTIRQTFLDVPFAAILAVGPIGGTTITSMALDLDSGWLYFVDNGGLPSFRRMLTGDTRPNFNGGEGLQILLDHNSGLVAPVGTAVEFEEHRIYLSDAGAGTIRIMEPDQVALSGAGAVEATRVEFSGLGAPGHLAFGDVNVGDAYRLDWPSEGTTMYNGSEVPVVWTATSAEAQNADLVDIRLLLNSTVVLDVATVENTGSYRWIVPNSLEPAARYRFLISSADTRLVAGVNVVYLSHASQGGVLSVYWSDTAVQNVSWTHAGSTGDENDIRVALEGFRPVALAADDDGGQLIVLEESALFLVDARDRTNVTQFWSGFVDGQDVALDPRTRTLYWTEQAHVRSAPVDVQPAVPSVVHEFATVVPATGVFRPQYLALDWLRGQLYWNDWVTRSIQRSNLDGTDLVDLYIELFQVSPKGITLDLVRRRLYLIDAFSDRLMYFAMDPEVTPGLPSSVTPVSSAVFTSVSDFAVAFGSPSVVWWVDIGSRKVGSIMLDGSDFTVVWDGLAPAESVEVAVDIRQPTSVVVSYRLATPSPKVIPAPPPPPVVPSVPIQEQTWFQATAVVLAVLIVCAVLYCLWRLAKLVLRAIKGTLMACLRCVRRWCVRRGWMEPPKPPENTDPRVLNVTGRKFIKEVRTRRAKRGYLDTRQTLHEIKHGIRVYEPDEWGYKEVVHPVTAAAHPEDDERTWVLPSPLKVPPTPSNSATVSPSGVVVARRSDSQPVQGYKSDSEGEGENAPVYPV